MEFATPLWNAGCPPFGSANIPGHFHDASTSTKTENGSTIREWEAFISAFSVGFTIVLGSFVAFISFHYFVWGWWLGKMIQDEDGGDG
jgi:hypothetical protein